MPSVNGNNPRSVTGRQYWRSLDELADTPEFRDFVYREFPAGATEMLSSGERRQFLKIMGASLALAGLGVGGLAGCRRWPEEKIAPFAHRPASRTPGVPVQYATSMELGGVATGLIATSFDGRPIKVDGNPEHPINRGASDPFIQASILDLYDPDRSQKVTHGGADSSWEAFTAWARQHFRGVQNAGGRRFAVLSEASSSPSLCAMRERLQQLLPAMSWHEYEALNNDNILEGSRLAFGSPHRAHYAFDQTRCVVALDADFLHCDGGGASIKWTRDFARSRNPDRGEMCRLYAFESVLTLTGANADHRVALRSSDVAGIAARLAMAVSPALEAALSADLRPLPDAERLAEAMRHVSEDFQTYRGASIVLAGPRQPAEVHYLAHMINKALGNVGRTVFYTSMPEAQPHVAAIRALSEAIGANEIDTLLILGGNPAYDAPTDLNFAERLKNVGTIIHLSDYVNETSRLCHWHINRAHYLETWGDGRSYDGTYTLQQPLIEPLFNGKSPSEVLAAVSGDERAAGYEIVRWAFNENAPVQGDFETVWRQALHLGFVENSAPLPEPPPEVVGRDPQEPVRAFFATAESGGPADELEVVFTQDFSVYDGRFANNGWLQELPDPISKLTWDNAILMSPRAAESRGLKTGDMATLRVNDREITAAVLVQPGQFAGSVTVALGYGRDFNGRIAQGAGFNVYPLRTTQTMGFARGATVTKAPGSYVLASTQDHHAVDSVAWKGTQERLPTLFREAALEEYRQHPEFAAHRTHVVHRLSLFEEDLPFHSPDGWEAKHAWGMSIDLTSCTGCNACVIACQAENNIPIVGKDQVRRNREMHWIRIDRYFKGFSHEQPDGYVLAPVTCMHCENAPCEQVCPVAATVHDEQGLNVMVYNRCVGTRYCSNNCPYKVRRFNYFDYHRRDPHREQPGMLLQVQPDYYVRGQAAAEPLRQLQFNPEVTVRSRGVMEKCTYCVQRIMRARIDAKNEWVAAKNAPGAAAPTGPVTIKDGTFTTACAQACPAQAIVFGDMNDKTSRVAALAKHPRAYEMLEELNTKPRTRYLAKVRNPAFGGEAHPGAAAAHSSTETPSEH